MLNFLQQNRKIKESQKIGIELINLLKLIKNLLDKKNIPFWLDQGTLLGAHRDGKLIPGDNDIDISLKYSKLSEVLNVINILTVEGYNVKFQKDLPVLDDLIQIYLKEDVNMNSKNHIDINIYRMKNNFYVRHGIHETLSLRAKYFLNLIRVLSSNRFHPRNIFLRLFLFLPKIIRSKIGYSLLKIYTFFFKNVSQSIPKHFFDEFIEISFLGMNLLVPKNTNDYLKFRFGTNWRTPNDGSREKWIWPNNLDKAVKIQRLYFLSMKYNNN